MEPKAEYQAGAIERQMGDLEAAQKLEVMAARLRSGEVHISVMTTTHDIEEIWYETAGGATKAFLRKVETMHLVVAPVDTSAGQLPLSIPDGPA